MHCHCGTNNRAPRWTFTDPCKPEVRPGAREESASPAWLAAPAMNARDTKKGICGGLTLDVDRHYIYKEKMLSIYFCVFHKLFHRGFVLPLVILWRASVTRVLHILGNDYYKVKSLIPFSISYFEL